jgi:NAD+ synthase (glutamine-hydrolysing)
VPFTTIHTVSLPGFGTTTRTRTNAQHLARAIGAEFREIDITPSVMQHFADIGHDPESHTVVYENAQARMRTTILMDVANMEQGIVVGTGDLSEIALGWSTFNADHMSMYNPNAGVPKTLVRELIRSEADRLDDLRAVLVDVLDTPISPELLPTSADGVQHQRTEDVLGPYEVHDFVLYHAIRRRCSAEQVAVLALLAFGSTYRDAQILHWVDTFYRRFVAAQFKRSAMPDGPKIGSVSLSPRADWRMPSDAVDIPWRDGVRRIAELAGITIPS